MSQKRRIFIAVNLPEDIKRQLLDFQKKWEYSFTRQSLGGGGPVRWTKKNSLHLTLVFIGYADEQEIYEICRLTKEVAKKYERLDLIFEKILYGPPGKPPRMIWLKGKVSEELANIKNELEEVFVSSQNLRAFRIEKRPFSPHITLARINMGQWLNLAQKPQIEQDFKSIIPVANIDVMESDLKRDGAEYTILESAPLGAD
ncbi:MAG: 2'-5' RNA ligase [Candidatus Portnoybacteria bacterium RBG_19FT_COMBO_36_7]|uniref:RNA 2',3'-cyclic phosphodiesterase n=1 Tax=Candidatus Portnoybacteria bacterium RBG_19FT_COMBO_36_7 TaxID=1801992 RepID=A0A1G2F9E6_9BACT|nr:MAG: 2'-5' RNA ligase [Candidatus Portnoybacteria bacterium RBG_19FT_COMBO_36_7]